MLGGKETLQKIHKIFYDKVYEPPWMRKFFEAIDQQVIEDQQTDFMMRALGGPNVYCGKLPVPAHRHMYITEELFEIRHEILKESLIEAGVSEELREVWLRIDYSFKEALVKKSFSDCEKRFNSDEIMNFPNPNKDDRKKAA